MLCLCQVSSAWEGHLEPAVGQERTFHGSSLLKTLRATGLQVVLAIDAVRIRESVWML